MSYVFRIFIVENQAIGFNYREPKTHHKTHRKGAQGTQVYRIQR